MTILELVNQFGLLSILAVSLAALTILIALAGVYAFFDVRRTARAVSTAEANRIAEVVAERVANNYLQAELPAMIAEYVKLAEDAVSAEKANGIAGAQEDDDAP